MGPRIDRPGRFLRRLRDRRRARPDIAILDIDLPGLDGLTVAGQLATQLPECHVIVLTGLGQPGNLLPALKTRMHGFIVKNAPAAFRWWVLGRSPGTNSLGGEQIQAHWPCFVLFAKLDICGPSSRAMRG
jgi:hypothetical protein